MRVCCHRLHNHHDAHRERFVGQPPRRLTFDSHHTDAGEAWAGRFEFFLTNPDDQPDRSRWDTELAFKLAD